MGNGVLPFIHHDIKYQDFFNNDEIETYSTANDLIDKLMKIKNSKNLIKRSKCKKDILNYLNAKLFLIIF